MHSFLIALHALSGLLALAVGVVALFRPRFFTTYAAALVVTLVSLGVVVAWDWRGLDPVARTLFTAFLGLGVVMLVQAERARRARANTTRAHTYLDALGFTLVSLADGFIVIAVLDLGGPIWAVVATGVVIAVAGHLLLVQQHHRLAAARPSVGTAG